MRSPRPLIGRIAFATCVLWPSAAGAQAWIPQPAEGSISLIHQFVRSDVHLNRIGDGTRELGSETLHVTFVEISYGIHERLAIEGSVNWLVTKWIGDVHHQHGPIDTGIYHGAMQDARLGIRYQAALRPLAVAPFAAFSVPTHRYETRGHSAFGRNLKELQLGVSVGRDLRGLAHLSYANATVFYAFSERVDGIDLDLDHLNGDFEIGARAGSLLHLRAFGTWQVMRDGLQLGPQTEHVHLTPIHDRLARSSYLQAGAGATIAVRPQLDLTLNGYATTSGRNFHAVRAFVTGVTWKLGGQFSIASPATLP